MSGLIARRFISAGLDEVGRAKVPIGGELRRSTPNRIGGPHEVEFPLENRRPHLAHPHRERELPLERFLLLRQRIGNPPSVAPELFRSKSPRIFTNPKPNSPAFMCRDQLSRSSVPLA
jgi:hypothetical protein